MIESKNKLMLGLATGVVMLSAVVHYLQREHQLFDFHRISMHGEQASANSLALNMFLIIPAILLLIGLYLYRARAKNHILLPACLVLALTAGSMSIIAGGGGGVEFHFSIFMVVALVAYYENIKLIVLMTVLFAVQHIGGFIWFPELVFGVMEYSLLMLLLHAIFLLLTSGATTLQIISKKRITEALEREKEAKQNELVVLLGRVRELSDQLELSSVTVSGRSQQTIRMNEEMSRSFHEFAAGMNVQTESVMNIEGSLHRINERIAHTANSSRDIIRLADHTSSSIERSGQGMGALVEQIGMAREEIRSIEEQTATLHEAAQQIDRVLSTVEDVASQTNLIALNAAIEASRAGEYGNSFGVVAIEIRKLAEKSKQSTDEVRSILFAIAEASAASVERSASGRQVSELAASRALEVIEDFERMSDDLNVMMQSVHELDHSIHLIEEASVLISREAKQITDVTQAGAASVEQLITISDTQRDAYAQVNQELVQLKTISQSLYKQFGDT